MANVEAQGVDVDVLDFTAGRYRDGQDCQQAAGTDEILHWPDCPQQEKARRYLPSSWFRCIIKSLSEWQVQKGGVPGTPLGDRGVRKVSKSRDQLQQELEALCRKVDHLEVCERNFRKLQKRYESLLNAAPDAMVFVDAAGRIVLGNAKLEQLFGYGPDELTGKKLERLIPRRYRREHAAYVAGYLSHPRARKMGGGLKISALRKDGSEFPVHISMNPLPTQDDAIVVAAIRDLTDEKQSEERLTLNYHIQRVISATLKTSLQSTPLDEQLRRVLDEVVSVPGLSFRKRGTIHLVEEDPEVLVLRAHRGISPSQRRACARIPFEICLCGKAAEKREVVFVDSLDNAHELRFKEISPHGHYCVPIVCGITCLGVLSVWIRQGHKRSEEEERFLTSIADTLAGIVRHHRSGKALEGSEAKYRTLVENINVGIYRSMGGPRARFLQANPALAKMLGFASVSDFVKRPVAKLFRDPREGRSVVEEILKKGVIKDRELRLRKNDGTVIWATLTAQAQFDEQDRLKWIDGVVEDITERKEAELERQRLQEQLAHSEKLAALGRLTQNIAHEIRNPLTSVGGFARRLHEAASEGTKEKRYSRLILSDVRRLERTLSNILTLASDRPPRLVPTNLHRVIDAALGMFGLICEEQAIEVRKSYADLPEIRIDPTQVLDAIVSLLSYVIRSMPKGGVLTAQTGQETIRRKAYLVLEVMDTGEGIPADKVEMIFEPYFTLEGTDRVTRLGLPASRKIVEAHGGLIRVFSAAGQGTTFRLYFPRNPKRSVASGKKPRGASHKREGAPGKKPEIT